MYGFVEHSEQAEGCNCPEEIDVWEMGGQNWHITGDERVNKYTNRSVYCDSCTGPFERASSPVVPPLIGGDPAEPAAVASCAGGYVVAGAGTAELNGCYSPSSQAYRGTAVYQLRPSPTGTFANASLFLYPQEIADKNTSNWFWRIGTLSSETGLVEHAFYSSPCATGATPLEFGWAVWGGSTHSPPPVLHAGAGKQTAATCPLPKPDKPPGPEGADCSVLRMQTYTVEWREHYARIYVDGNLVSQFDAATWSDDADRNYFGKYTDSIVWGFGGPGHTAIEWIQQPLFLAFTSCVMNDVPLLAEGDQSPMYFVVDSVRVCE